MIADIIINETLNLIETELFIRGTKLNISIGFVTQSYFKVPKEVRLNTTKFFIMKIPNKREVQQIALNIFIYTHQILTLKTFNKFIKKYTVEPYYVLDNDTTLPSNNPLRFGKNLLK